MTEESDDKLTEFFDLLKLSIDEGANNNELADIIIAAVSDNIFQEIFDNKIDTHIFHQRMEDVLEKTKKDIREEIIKELSSESKRDQIRKELRIKIENEIRSEVEDEIRSEINENFELILGGDNENSMFKDFFEISMEEMQRLLFTNNYFMKILAAKMKNEINTHLKNGNIPEIYRFIIDDMKSEIKNEMKNNKKIISEIKTEIIKDLAGKILN